MDDHKTALGNLVAGDIFHAESPNGASLICLVMLVTENTILARTVTTQIELEFDRRTGIAEWGAESVSCTIDSIASLPIEIHNVILGIDHKFRLETDIERVKLNDLEKKALLYVGPHYASNRL